MTVIRQWTDESRNQLKPGIFKALTVALKRVEWETARRRGPIRRRMKVTQGRMNDKEVLYGRLDRQLRLWEKIHAYIDSILLSVMLFLIIFTGSGLADGLLFLKEGRDGTKYQGFARLLETNPDTVGWIIIDGTHIDHPVVRSADNFDYLDRDFEGNYSAGGTLFMDKGNRSIEDPYCIIHGHHMAAGAMFGDLDRFLDPDFFEKNRTGTLMTPSCDYDIRVFASGIFNAYDKEIYGTGGTVPLDHVRENAVNMRPFFSQSHVLALSTCKDDMTDSRVVVFCELLEGRPHG